MSVLSDLVVDVEKLNTDMYKGDGKENPSVTVRLDRLEQAVGMIRWAVTIAVGAIIVDIISNHIK